MNEEFDLIAVGDTVVDAFIKVKVGHVIKLSEGTEYCLPFGSKIPYESVTVIPAVGNSANASVSAARLDLKSSLVSFLGADANGKDCLHKLETEKVNTKLISVQTGKQTNYHYVLWHDDERTILVKHENFESKLPALPKTKWIYLSSLGEHALPLHDEIAEYITSNSDVKLAFQPGTFQISLGYEKLKAVYTASTSICANKEEMKDILKTEENDPKKIMDKMSELGPKIVIMTDGVNGCYIKDENGNHFHMPCYKDIAPPLERTGAGDALFSTFISYLIKGMSTEEAIRRAPINSMNVVQFVGAQAGLLTPTEIEHYLETAGEEYKLQQI